jgi:hypothetical protein
LAELAKHRAAMKKVNKTVVLALKNVTSLRLDPSISRLGFARG